MGRRQRHKKYQFKYAVLGEGITEQYYLASLKDLKQYNYSIRPKLFQDVSVEKAEHIIEELLSGGCDQIVFFTDYDIIVNQDKKDAFERLYNKYMDVDTVLICESMPSIEYWFLLHFRYTTKEFSDCKDVIVELKKYIKDYSKSGKFLKTEQWFKTLIDNGGLECAMKNAGKGLKCKEEFGASKHFPYTKIHLAIETFDKLIEKK